MADVDMKDASTAGKGKSAAADGKPRFEVKKVRTSFELHCNHVTS